MLLKVNPHKIEIVKSPVNEREINISKCQFEFADEITNDYVKEAYFTFEGTTYKQIIVNNECDIPSEVLTEKGQVEIGVVAFKTEGAEEIKRYNPSPAYFNTWVGSLKDNAENSEPITPTDKEQVEQMLNNINVDANKEGKITTITITFKDGTTKDVTLEDGMGIDYNWVGTQLGIKREDEQEYKYVDLKGEKGDAGAIRMRIVQELPFVGDEDTMYLVPLEEPETEDNRYAEYIYVNNQWELLGKIGIQVDLSDYYTKSQVYNKEETDTKVNAKYTKPSDGIPKEDLSQSVQASLNKADSSIQDVSGKEDKTNKVTSLSSSSTNDQYPSAKCVYDSQETQNNDIQDLQEENNELKGIINNIYDIDNYLLKNHSIESEETTESITLNNTMNKAPMSLTLKGNIEQDSTTGKNLFSTDFKTTDNLTTYTKIDSNSFSFTCSGTWKGATFIVPCKENTDYFFNYSDTSNTYCYLKGTQTNTDLMTRYSGYFHTFNSGANTTLTITISNGNNRGVTSGTVSNIQLEEGTTTTSFEKYSGGSPAPSPSYPQDIHIVSGDNEIKVCNKNLINSTAYNKAINTSGVVIIPATTTNYLSINDYVSVKPNTTYTISFEKEDGGRLLIGTKDQNGEFIERTDLGVTRTFTTGNNVYQAFLYLYKAKGSYTEGGWVQLEQGTTATDYVEHQEYTKEINLPVENLFDVSAISQSTYIGSNGTTGTSSVSNLSDYIKVNANQPYYLSYTYDTLLNTADRALCYYDENKQYLSGIPANPATFHSFTPTQDGYIRFAYDKNYQNIQLEKGSKANSYTPYGTTPIELNKIGNYQDYFYKTNKWYLHKEIEKKIVLESEIVTQTDSYTNVRYFKFNKETNDIDYNKYNATNIFYSSATLNNGYNYDSASMIGKINPTAEATRYWVGFSKSSTLSEAKEKLTNSILYYPLETPENILLNDTLQETLDSFYSWQEQTNISQENNDLPFVIKARAIKEIL